ncbi:MAG: ald [Gammaproteobacteria bacterium]|jgi:alanine dehydrogenase|nr:ald [Gammaproteobacteria bacterium]
MRIGLPKEIKTLENRVALVPSSVHELTRCGHEVFVETNAGLGIGISDAEYVAVGAKILPRAADVFSSASLIVKVKEPQPIECKMLTQDHTLFTYLHLAPDPQQAELLLASECCAIAYETVTDAYQGLPLLSPMSEVAGRMAIQAGAHCLEKPQGGSGVLLGGVPGVASAKVVILGGGVVGTNAIRMAIGQEAQVTVIDRSLKRLKELDLQFASRLSTLYATGHAIEKAVVNADLVIGAVLVPGAAAPRLVTREHLKKMRKGSVLVDVAIDQGGCFETSRPTTHAEPIYEEEGIIHYCVANMPGAVPRTAAFALNNATLPFVMDLANKGIKQALLEDPHLLNGLNVYRGHITYKAVAESLNKAYVPALEALCGFD